MDSRAARRTAGRLVGSPTWKEVGVRAPVLLALVAALLLVGCERALPRQPASAAPPSADAPTAEDPSIWALHPADGLVQLSMDGERQRSIHVEGEDLRDLELVAVRDAALLVRTRDGRDEIVEVSLADASVRVLADGTDPAVTSDGAHLAFVRSVGNGQRELVHRTYGGVEVRTWPLSEEAQRPLDLDQLTWSRSAEKLGLILRTADRNELRELHLPADSTVRGASVPVPPERVGAVFTAARFRLPEELTLGVGCCAADGYGRWRIVDLVPATGQVSEVTTVDGPVIALDWSRDLQQLLYVVGPTTIGTDGRRVGDGEPVLFVLTHAGPEELGAGYTDAAWGPISSRSR